MKYQAYPEYKYSGVEWLENIPVDWCSLGLGKLIKFMNNGISVTQVEESDQTVPVTRIETISTGAINLDKVGYIDRQSASQRFLIKKGDIQFSNINSLSMVGNCAIYDGFLELYAGMNLLHIRPREELINPKYMLYQFKTKWFRNRVEANAKPAINQASIPTRVLKQLGFLCPPLDEQQKIADFLDHETAKIDSLIEKQQQLITLLKEKRQAVISHAVTKGLNPDAPMRDSGVESIGLIPKHWALKSLSLASKKLAVGLAMSVTDCYEDEGVPIIRNQNIKEGYFDGSDMLYLNPAFAEAQSSKKVKAGDVIIVRTGSNVGLTCCVPEDYDECHTFTTLIVTPSSELDKEYFTYCMNSAFGKAEVNRLKFGFGKDNLNVGELRAMHTLLPNISEQKEIVLFLREKVSNIELIIKKTYVAIDFMQERRGALISAAVTGKIDVRNWQAPKQVTNEPKEAAA